MKKFFSILTLLTVVIQGCTPQPTVLIEKITDTKDTSEFIVVVAPPTHSVSIYTEHSNDNKKRALCYFPAKSILTEDDKSSYKQSLEANVDLTNKILESAKNNNKIDAEILNEINKNIKQTNNSLQVMDNRNTHFDTFFSGMCTLQMNSDFKIDNSSAILELIASEIDHSAPIKNSN